MLAGDSNHAVGKPKLVCLTGWEQTVQTIHTTARLQENILTPEHRLLLDVWVVVQRWDYD